jgi:hypothetical protein
LIEYHPFVRRVHVRLHVGQLQWSNDSLSGLRVPDPYCFIIGSTHDPSSVSVQQRYYPRCVSRPFSDDLGSGVNVPQPHCTVHTFANHSLPVRRQCDSDHSSPLVSPVCSDLFSALHVPHLQRAVPRTGHHPLSLSQVYDIADPFGVPFTFSVWDYRLCLLHPCGW